LLEAEAADVGCAGVGCAPEDKHDREVKERKKAPHGEVEPVDEIALKAD
jgi:hypothetical protein